MEYKRLTILCGHYGTGKTNCAVNMAMDLKRQCPKVAVADLDIVNPYFRTKDSEGEFEKAGIELICSRYANTNLDIPALPENLYRITEDRDTKMILDIGGDDSGAIVLGRLASAILEENDYEMLTVINKYRPLTPDVESTVEVLREIEAASRIPFTGIVNNSNLGEETVPEDVAASLKYAEDVASAMGIPVVMTTVKADLYEELAGKIPNLFPLQLQRKIL
ncbi:MAG: hypothetical protein II227_05795 [Clostridia bacterium]|nr:hypothetical protein [Clostridia bacterium]